MIMPTISIYKVLSKKGIQNPLFPLWYARRFSNLIYNECKYKCTFLSSVKGGLNGFAKCIDSCQAA